MARRKDKEKAVALRKKGMSYSQIKKKLDVSKSTLSYWLKNMPLPKKRLDELQRSSSVIEKIRETKRKKKEARLLEIYKTVSKDIGSLSSREFLVAGFFLYWAEGGKTKPYTISLSNTDPSMIRCYVQWLVLLGVPKNKILVRLHLYSDMDIRKEMSFWSKEIDVPRSYFRKPYIKKSKFSNVTHATFGHGTCNIIVNGRDISEYVLQGIKRISDMY